MRTTFLAAALLSTALAGTAYAQTAPQSSTPAAPAAKSTTTTTSSDDKMMLKDSWRASKLIGLDVHNEANEKLGEINELIVDKQGKINAVVIGVGGFLGMGEHDIAVAMDKLKFVETPIRTSSNTTTPARTEGSTTTTGAATGTKATTTTATANNTNDWTPDHAVMSGNKEQLKAMPQFKYSDYN